MAASPQPSVGDLIDDMPQTCNQSPLRWVDDLMRSGEAWSLQGGILGDDLLGQHSSADSGPAAKQGQQLEAGCLPEQSAAASPTESTEPAEHHVPAKRGRKRGASRGAQETARAVKSQREKDRRQRENDRLAELGMLIDSSRAARADKLSILTDAIKEVKRLRDESAALQRLNKILEERVNDLKRHEQPEPRVQPQQQPQKSAMMAPQQPPTVAKQQPLAVQQEPQPVQPELQQAQMQMLSQPQMPEPQQLMPMQPPMPQMPGFAHTGFGSGMVAVPMAAFQQLLTARMASAKGVAPGDCFAPQPDTLSAAACLYMSSADLDVSADASKRPVAA